MTEIRLENESLDDALRRFKDNVHAQAFFMSIEKENIMKNQV